MSSTLRSWWTLDPAVTFLNHGSFGACPLPVLEHQRRERDAMEAEPVRYLARDLEGRLDESRRALAAFLGADARDLVFVPNATTGVNAVLGSLDLGGGDEILVTDHGYNACTNVARHVVARTGAKVVTARVPFPIAGPDTALEAVLGAVTPRTRLALLDHVTSPTALVLPVDRLVRELEGRGVAVLVDGAHAPGMVPLDLEQLGASYYTGNCHKWLCAPKGAGFLHVRRELQERVRPAVISHGANSTRTDRSRFLIEFDWTGTLDPTAVLSIPAALAFMASIVPGGWPEILGRNHALAVEARVLLARTLAVDLPCPDEMIGSMAALALPDGDPGPQSSPLYQDPLQDLLFARAGIEVPVIPWPAPPRRWIRVSAQAYNAIDDYAYLANALRSTLPTRS